MEHSKSAKEFYELFRKVREEIADENGYHLAAAIMNTFDRWNKWEYNGLPAEINKICDAVQNSCQLLAGIKPDAVRENWWSEWDESVYQSLIELLKIFQPYYNKQTNEASKR